LNEVTTIKLWQIKCRFCGQKMTHPDRKELKRIYANHIDNCEVLKCVCIAKDIEFPIKQGVDYAR